MEIVTVVAASGGFCLLLVIILTIVVIRIKKRLKGAFADRNKVYAMEQCGNHVKENNNKNYPSSSSSYVASKMSSHS